MKCRPFGKTGLQVSLIGLGTAQIGGPSLIQGELSGMPRIPRSEAVLILEKAFDSGINFFDAADKYGDGEAERLLGRVLGPRRNQVVFATKCGVTSSGARCFDEPYVRKCLEGSLANLRTDHIDVFQLTKPPMGLILSGEIYGMLDRLKKEGKIRFSGISVGSDEEAAKLIQDGRVDSLQIFFNLLHTAPNRLYLKRAFDAGIGIIVRSPLSSGVLSGKLTRDTRFPREDVRSRFLHGDTLEQRLECVENIVRRHCLEDKGGILPFAMNYLVSNPFISTVIPGASRVLQLEGILEVLQHKPMTAVEIEALEKHVESVLTGFRQDEARC